MGRHYPTRGNFEHRPLYEELAEEFCRRITVGRWPVGRPLKTEAMIAAELGVSLGTVRRAFDRLEGMNLIDRTPGAERSSVSSTASVASPRSPTWWTWRARR